jgi:hypothetical protein
MRGDRQQERASSAAYAALAIGSLTTSLFFSSLLAFATGVASGDLFAGLPY